MPSTWTRLPRSRSPRHSSARPGPARLAFGCAGALRLEAGFRPSVARTGCGPGLCLGPFPIAGRGGGRGGRRGRGGVDENGSAQFLLGAVAGRAGSWGSGRGAGRIRHLGHITLVVARLERPPCRNPGGGSGRCLGLSSSPHRPTQGPLRTAPSAPERTRCVRPGTAPMIPLPPWCRYRVGTHRWPGRRNWVLRPWWPPCARPPAPPPPGWPGCGPTPASFGWLTSTNTC